ncbi:MAG: hypothetical protein JEZ00_17535 [Anaerolineaceae bacterium]|nr:hypothetical protein [Anaerolineaceae bacterium]
MIISIIALLCTVIICVSFGLLLESIIEKIEPSRASQKLNLHLTLLMGLFFTSFLLMAIHFFFNINGIILTCFILISLLTIIIKRKKISQLFDFKLNNNKHLLLVPVICISVFSILLNFSDSIYVYDLGLYHLQNIKWIETYPIVHGLGNLHGRFAFNSNWFLLAALFGYKSILGQRVFVINALLILIFVSTFLNYIAMISKNHQSSKFALFIFIFSSISIYRFANSPSTDIPCDIIIWIILILFLDKKERKDFNVWDKHSWVILFLSVFIVTVKVSSAFILILPIYLLLQDIKSNKKSVLFAILFSGIYLSLWVLRNIIISGTIIYPLALSQLPWFDWSIPQEQVKQMEYIIQSWAIKPNTPIQEILSMSFIEKFLTWREYKPLFFQVIIFLGFLGNIVFFTIDLFICIKNKTNWKTMKSHDLILNIYLLVSLLYWYLNAPDPRFAYGVIFAAISIFLVRCIQYVRFSRLSRDFILLFLLLVTAWGTYIFAPWNSIETYLLYPPDTPAFSITKVNLIDGTFIYTPTDGDQCWDAPLPCSPWLEDGLLMRGLSISDGYKIISAK